MGKVGKITRLDIEEKITGVGLWVKITIWTAVLNCTIGLLDIIFAARAKEIVIATACEVRIRRWFGPTGVKVSGKERGIADIGI